MIGPYGHFVLYQWRLSLVHHPVIPAKAGIQAVGNEFVALDTGFRRYDGVSYDSNSNAFGISPVVQRGNFLSASSPEQPF